MLYECEKAFFVIIVTERTSQSHDDFDRRGPLGPSDALGFSDFGYRRHGRRLIGNYHADAEVEEPGGADEATYYLDDIAKFMFDKDFRPDLGGDQTIDTYTVGFATRRRHRRLPRSEPPSSATAPSTSVQDGDQLTFALIAALNDIIEKAASFTAATVPSARTADGADFYQSYFFPRGKSAFWEGHIRAWKIDARRRHPRRRTANCALDDPTWVSATAGRSSRDARSISGTRRNEVPVESFEAISTSRRAGCRRPSSTAARLRPRRTSPRRTCCSIPFAVPPGPRPQ